MIWAAGIDIYQLFAFVLENHKRRGAAVTPEDVEIRWVSKLAIGLLVLLSMVTQLLLPVAVAYGTTRANWEVLSKCVARLTTPSPRVTTGTVCADDNHWQCAQCLCHDAYRFLKLSCRCLPLSLVFKLMTVFVFAKQRVLLGEWRSSPHWHWHCQWCEHFYGAGRDRLGESLWRISVAVRRR